MTHQFCVILPETLDTLQLPGMVPVVQRFTIALLAKTTVVTVRWYAEQPDFSALDMRGRLAGVYYDTSGAIWWIGRSPNSQEQIRVDLMLVILERLRRGDAPWRPTETEARHWGLS